MKGNILSSHYREASGTSYVRKSTKYGTFSAITIVGPEDEDIANQWDGCRFAEYLCDLQAERIRVNALHERYIGVLNSYKNVSKTLAVEDGCYDSHKIIVLWKRQINHAKRQWLDAKEKYESMDKNYHRFCDNVLAQRRKARDQINKLRQEASE